MKQFSLTDKYGSQYWYLDTVDRSDEVLSGRIYAADLYWHRDDGPAVVWADGSQGWWLNGIRHREDGPAYLWADGSRCWYVNGKLHRLDGPAFIRADGRQGWCVKDKEYRDNKSFQKAAGITDEEMVILIIKYGNVV